MLRHRRKLLIAAMAIALATTGAAAANAVVWGGTSSNCQYNEQVRIAARTTGNTSHWAGGTTWDKGYKNNSGSTTYTGMSGTVSWRVTATEVPSAGVTCAPR